MAKRVKFKPRLIAHRGWSLGYPENSIPAIAAALAAEADEIEIDVRVSADGIPFVIHDEAIDGLSDQSGKVRELSAAQLKKANLVDNKGQVMLGLGFSTLQEVLSIYAEHISINIHIKESGPQNVALHLINAYFLRNPGELYIASDAEILKAALEICPHVPRCLNQTKNDDIRDIMDQAEALLCERIQLYRGIYTQDDLEACLAKGFITNLYWSDDPLEAEEFIRGGILGLLTNDIGPVRHHLLEVGLI